MNTQGWIRGLISYNSPLDKFVKFVLATLSEEFEIVTKVTVSRDNFILNIGNYKFELTKEEITLLQKKSPYAFDRYILDRLKDMGFEFDCYRSQYIKYCYGLI